MNADRSLKTNIHLHLSWKNRIESARLSEQTKGWKITELVWLVGKTVN